VQQFTRTRIITLIAILAALANILSLPFLTIPLVIGPFNSAIHFTQLPIFLSGILAGPWAGFITGIIGGLYMSYSAGIPFIIGGLGILGFMTGVFTHKLQLHPAVASGFAWCVQAPYVFVTDYLWFISTRTMPPEVAMPIVTSILVKLTIEAVISATLSAILVKYLQRVGVLQVQNVW
jgi:thiamine transporter ThiT